MNLFRLIILFIALYVVVIGLFEMSNRWLNLGAGLLIAQIVFLYIYLMFILRKQLLYYEFTIKDEHLIVKEYLSKREKTLLIVPFSHILSIENLQQHKDRYYNKRMRISIRGMKDRGVHYIEYDDYADISLLKIQCSDEFIDEVCKHI